MRSSRSLFRVALALTLLVSVGGAMAQEQEEAKWEPWGPHVDEIFMPINADYNALMSAFERGEIHVLPGIFGLSWIDQLKANPNADVVTNYGHHIFFLCFNMRNKPLDADAVRHAMAHLIDRERIINEVLRISALPLSSFLPPSNAFHNEDVPVRLYDPAKAAEILELAGYTMDVAAKIRRDPATRQPMREMRVIASGSVGESIAKYIQKECQAIGLPVRAQAVKSDDLFARFHNNEFDLYLGAYGLNRFPTSLYHFFHSSQCAAGEYNNCGIKDPQLDKALEEIYCASDLQTAKKAADQAQVILAERQPWVPIYSRPYIDVFRKDMFTGYVPMHGVGAAGNAWTPLNIRPTSGTGGVVRWPLTGEINTLNPCTATLSYESEVLGKITDSLIAVDPVTLEDIPWMAREWEIGTWEPAKGKRGTVITWHLNDGILWQDGEPFTSADIKFTIEYLKKYRVPRCANAVQDIVKVETPDRLTAKVYFSTESYWHLYSADLCFLPEHIWKSVWNYKTFSPWQQRHPKVKDLTRLIGTGPFILKEFSPGKHVRLVKNPLYWRLNPPDGAEN